MKQSSKTRINEQKSKDKKKRHDQKREWMSYSTSIESMAAEVSSRLRSSILAYCTVNL